MKKGIQMIGQVAWVGLLTLGVAGLAKAQSPPLWGNLRPGDHGVGFKSLWRLDHARRYSMTFDDKTTHATEKAPRPILINLWYPADKAGGLKTMPHRDYLHIRSVNPQLTRFSTKLMEYNRAVVVKETLGKSTKELTHQERALWRQFMDTPTACFRDARPAEGRYPTLIYHAGFGSSFEDNSVLCEFLASHGYIVLGSAFQEPSGASFNVDGEETSACDMQFLIAYAKQLPNVDWSRVGVIGHSGGAHAALIFRARSDCAADAIVSLDTTQDYYSMADLRWRSLISTVTRNRKNMTGPLLMVANPHAFFQLADSLSSARRYYLTIKNLDHNDFISQGLIGRKLRYRLRFCNSPEARQNNRSAAVAKEKASLEAVQSAYESLCVYILRFLDAELKGDAAGKKFLEKQYRDTSLAGAALHAVHMPVGRTGPEPYSENSSQPPTPRQVRSFLSKHGRAITITMLKRFRKESPSESIYHPVFGLALVDELLDQRKIKDAIAFRDFYRENGVDCDKALLGRAKLYLRLGSKSFAGDYFKKVLLLDPANREAADGLKEVGELGKKSGGC